MSREVAYRVLNRWLRHLDSVTPNQRERLILRFGLDDGKPKKFSTVAAIVGVAESTVRDNITSALWSLHKEYGGPHWTKVYPYVNTVPKLEHFLRNRWKGTTPEDRVIPLRTL